MRLTVKVNCLCGLHLLMGTEAMSLLELTVEEKASFLDEVFGLFEDLLHDREKTDEMPLPPTTLIEEPSPQGGDGKDGADWAELNAELDRWEESYDVILREKEVLRAERDQLRSDLTALEKHHDETVTAFNSEIDALEEVDRLARLYVEAPPQVRGEVYRDLAALFPSDPTPSSPQEKAKGRRSHE